MGYNIEKEIRDKPLLRHSFFLLAQQTFGLSFERWYRQGYWSDRYQPYCMVHNDEVVANVSVNQMDFLWEGRPRHYVQLGTVMTRPDHRGKGLSRRLMEEVLKDCSASSHCVYLYANPTVVNFYPRFGFQREKEFGCSFSISGAMGIGRKLEMDNWEDRMLLKRYFSYSNPFSRMTMLQNWGLLMFYCSDFLKDAVYFLEERQLIAVMQQEGETLHCMDLFGPEGGALLPVLQQLAAPGVKQVVLGFSPKEIEERKLTPLSQEEDILFCLEGTENPWRSSRLMLPELSHA